MRAIPLIALMLLTACSYNQEEELNVATEPPIQQVTGCGAIAKAWCEHHIACGSAYDNLSECMEVIQWLYCPSDNTVLSGDKAAMCHHDLVTAECDSFEMSWPGSCYDALGFEEGC